MKKLLMVTFAIGALTLGIAPNASAAAPGNPVDFCRASNNADGYLGSHGGCVSSVASIGLDALMEGAFPSRPAAVANCKQIAALYGGYPYYFYGNFGNDAYKATNINSCVNTLYLFHTGQLPPGYQG